MYETLLPERARPAYRVSRWKPLLDSRTETLVNRGYSPGTVAHHLREWVDFVGGFEETGGPLPDNVRELAVVVYLERRCLGRQNDYGGVRTALRLILERGGEWVRRLPSPCKPTSALYDATVPAYLAFARHHRGRRSFRLDECVLREFFGWLDAQGVDELGALSAVHVRDYLASREHLKPVTVAGHASKLRCLLRYLGMESAVPTGLAMAVVSPRLYRLRDLPAVLDKDAVANLVRAVDRSTALGKRDYAMLLLAARYGMRPGDIRGLRLDEIHWRQRRIAFQQAKTGRVLELPLLEDVDEALVDYLRHGRPDCVAREVFVRHLAPIAPFGPYNNLWAVMHRAFQASGIAPPLGRRGLYLLRHSAATGMLDRGAPFGTISNVLGHASMESTRIYAKVDLAGLRTVALSTAQVRP